MFKTIVFIFEHKISMAKVVFVYNIHFFISLLLKLYLKITCHHTFELVNEEYFIITCDKYIFRQEK